MDAIGGGVDMEVTSRLVLGYEEQAEKQMESASSYAVYDDLVYIRYMFEDGTVMLMRSPVGTDDFSQVEYVTDGEFEQFCVYQNYLYLTLPKDGCLYRVDISRIQETEDARQQLSVWEDEGMLHQISPIPIDRESPFVIMNDVVFAVVTGQEKGEYEFLRLSLDGTTKARTSLQMRMTNFEFKDDYLYFTVRDGQETVLYRMRLDGCYYQELARYQGDISAMVVSGEEIYYLLNGTQGAESYLGCIGINGIGERVLSSKDNESLDYCYMTGIVDYANIYYTCSTSGTELLNNLYCYSLETGVNKQISSECGRYIVTSDDIDYIIFASMDGSEIRQMNKDGSNPKVMREADGSTGVLEQVDITSLSIIEDHVYYLDGPNVAYKEIKGKKLGNI